MNRKLKTVVAEVQIVQEPPPERQHINSKKWQWSITVQFTRWLPAIRPEKFGELNALLLMTEVDRLLVGMDFVTVRTDDLQVYEPYELACAVCKCFNFSITDIRVLKPLLNATPEER